MEQHSKKVVLLTDMGTVNLMLKSTLKPHNYAITVLQSENPDFFSALLEIQPDIVFLRTELNHANGIEVCDRIKHEPRLGKTRVVFLSSNPKVRELAIEHHADRFLTMPFSSSDLVETATALSVIRPVILYVDDSDLMHAKVVPHLKEEDFEVLEAWDGREAMELIDQRDGLIDLIISDVEMPVMDGIMLCKTVRSTRVEDISILLLTSLDSEESIARGFNAGANDYLTKPVLIHELILRIKRLLKTGQRQEESLRTEKILVVDDSPVIRGMILMALRSHGFMAEAVEHGLAALAKLNEKKFHLLITDYEMPHMNGVELCLKIRQEPSSSQRIPIIFVTSHDTKADEVKIRSLGVQAFITKPLKTEQFLAETERVLAEVQLERQTRQLTHYFPDQGMTKAKRSDSNETLMAVDQFRTILFTGVADFRTLVNSLDAKTLMTVLNRYFARLNEILERFDVMADNILEDRMFVSFGQQDQGAMRAIECAKAMHLAILELRRTTGSNLYMQTGIHSGHLMIGKLDTLPHHKIVIIGENINTARRIKELAPPGEVVLSETTMALVQTLIKTRPLDSVKIQDGSIRVFQVIT
ncbi:MAG: response regulator [Magnetococcus sp. YQC-5]